MLFELERDKSAFYHKGYNACPAHFHHSIEVLYVLSGEMTVFVNGKEYLLNEKDVLFVLPYCVHTFPYQLDTQQIALTIPAEYCQRFEQLCGNLQPISPIIHDKNGEYLAIIKQMERPSNSLQFDGLSNCLLGAFIRDSKFSAIKDMPDRTLAEQIAFYIDENFASPLTLKQIAEYFGYSPSHFSVLFHKIFRTGLSQYINSVRIEKSLPLLKTQSISTVCYSCGFQSPQQYFLNFKKLYGCSPKEFLSRR